MSQPTPGPWRVDEGCYAVRADALPLSGKTGLDSGVVCVAVRSPEDARLIAAAPEMAVLLGKVIQWQSGQPIEMLLDEARALLREIEGETT